MGEAKKEEEKKVGSKETHYVLINNQVKTVISAFDGIFPMEYTYIVHFFYLLRCGVKYMRGLDGIAEYGIDRCVVKWHVNASKRKHCWDLVAV